MNKIKRFLESFVTPLDLFVSKTRAQPGKLKIGFCSAFPPTPNGAAAVAYYFTKELMNRKGVQLFAIPLANRINKKLFRGIDFARVSASFFDSIIFFCLGTGFEKIASKAIVPSIAWQTMHVSPKKSKGEKNVFAQISKADKIIACTKFALEQYALCGAKSITYIPIGVDLSEFKPAKKQSRNSANFRVLFVNRAQYYKGVLPFLESIPLVLEKHPETIFDFHAPIDKNSPFLDEILEKITEAKKSFPKNFFHESSWIEFSKLPKKYEKANVLVFPSNNEGFGVPLIEAMASGLPCITINKKPMNEIVADKKTGYCLQASKEYHGIMFPAPEAIAERISYLIENPKVCREFGLKGRERAEKEYNLKKTVDNMLIEIKALAGK